MSLFSALNERILAAIDKRSGTDRLSRVGFEAEDLLLTHAGGSDRRLAWGGLEHAVAIRSQAYAVDEICVLLEFADCGVIEVPASCPGWMDLCAAIEKLDGARPFGQWHAEVISAPVGRAVEVWSRPPRTPLPA